jgi:hypothetical protein
MAKSSDVLTFKKIMQRIYGIYAGATLCSEVSWTRVCCLSRRSLETTHPRTVHPSTVQYSACFRKIFTTVEHVMQPREPRHVKRCKIFDLINEQCRTSHGPLHCEECGKVSVMLCRNSSWRSVNGSGVRHSGHVLDSVDCRIPTTQSSWNVCLQCGKVVDGRSVIASKHTAQTIVSFSFSFSFNTIGFTETDTSVSLLFERVSGAIFLGFEVVSLPTSSEKLELLSLQNN